MNKPQIIIGGMTVAGAAIAAAIIKPMEGLRLQAYRDPIGIVSDCWGHTKTAELGHVNTEAECATKLQADMQEHWDGVVKCAPVLRDMPPHVQGATLAWVYNVGVGGACGSTAFAELRAGDLPGYCEEMARWVCGTEKDTGLRKLTAKDLAVCPTSEANKKRGRISFVLPGLERRASIQRAVCEGRPLSLGGAG